MYKLFLLVVTISDVITFGQAAITITAPPAATPPFKVTPALKEDLNKVTQVYTCEATSDNPDATVFYTVSIVPNDGKFTFDHETGILSTVAEPNFEADGGAVPPDPLEYTVTLTAHTGDEKESRDFIVPVENVNEPPRIVNLPGTIKINENDRGNWSMLTLIVEDPDDDEWTFSYQSVTPPGTEEKFQLNGMITQPKNKNVNQNLVNELWLKYLPDLNCEEIHDFNLSIIATDAGGLSSVPLYFHIELRDINENPVFTDSTATATVYEESPIGTTLVTSVAPIRALDPDIKRNDTVRYVLEGKYADYFDIKTIHQEAVITIVERIDREDLNVPIDGNFDLYVSAIDQYQLRQVVSNTFKITVTPLDINDHPTVCNPTVYLGTIKENSPIDTSILTVSCADSDDTSTNPITYRVNTTGSPETPDAFKYFYFPNSHKSQVLSAKFAMDLERGTLLKFKVDVAQGANLDSSTVTLSVEITVVGENDNRPVMSQPFYNYEFRYDVDIGTEVGTVSASDNDVTDSVLTYDWVYAVTEFFMHTQSGSITTKQHFDINQTFTYYAQATDNDNPPGPDVSQHSPVRFDTFDPELLLIDFEVTQPLSYFTVDKRKEFQDAISSACPPCLGRISSLKETSTSTTTITAYALKDATTESYENSQVKKQYVSQAEMLDIFRRDEEGTPSPAVALPKFFNFPVVKVTPTCFGLSFLDWLLYTPEGNAVLALACIAVLSSFIGALIYLWRTGALARLFRLLMQCNIANLCKDCCKPSEPKQVRHIKRPDSGGDFNVFEFRYKDKPLAPEAQHNGKKA